MGYLLEGRLVEICSCATLCPCWAGFEPDNGACHFSWIFHFDHGWTDGVNMAGTNLALIGVLPGDMATGGGRVVAILDVKDSPQQHEMLVRAVRGQLGGVLDDLAGSIAEVVAVETATIEFDVRHGTGTYRVDGWFSGESEGIRSPLGRRMEIRHSALAPVLGDPAYPGKVTRHEISDPRYGFEFTAHQATQTNIRYVHV